MLQYACLASLLPLVAAHGFLSSPPARRPGAAYRATCGEQPFYQQSSDINGNVQGIQQVVGSDKTEDCNLWLCKGFLLEDNPDLVQSYSLGQTIDVTVTIAAPHTGYANVSVVKTSSNTMIGNPLIEFQNYASNAGMAANNTAFSITLPDTLGGDCTTAGDCVLQWFWDAPDIDQTYLACADFTVAGGSAGSSSSSTAPASTASASTVSASTVFASTAPASSASATSDTVVTTAPPAVTATSIDTAPTTTSTAVPDNTDDDECSADDDDEDDDEGEGDDGDDDECPTDDGQEDDDDDDTEEECPVDVDDGAAATSTLSAKDISTSVAAATSTLSAKDVSTSAAATVTRSHTSTITQVITSTVTTERVVTVTAPATACN